jgi:perosamine synthetase
VNDRSIPFGRPMVDEAERAAVSAVLSSYQFVHGPKTKEFERRFAERVGTKHAVSVSSCTAGLHLALFVNDIGPGDEVIVPAMTHVATAHAAEFCNARPIFADVLPESGNIDPNAIARAITPKTKAIIVVHYLGLPCDMDRIRPMAEKAGLLLIEDCALAVDAKYDGYNCGSLGSAGCFSFYPVKHITTLEGGMVTTDDERVADAVRKRKAFGYDRMLGERAKPGIYDVDELGYNYRMNEVEAAIGLVQLDKLDRFQARRAENFRVLRDSLAERGEITIFDPVQGKAVSSHYCLNVVLPRDGSIDRDAVMATLKDDGIGVSVHYPVAVPLMRYYRRKYDYADGAFPVAEWLAAQTISLPVGPHLSTEDAAYVGESVKRAIDSVRS